QRQPRVDVPARPATFCLLPAMAQPVLWRWGLGCLISGLLGWVRRASTQEMRPSASPPWLDECPEEDEEEKPASQ
ncbi:MAG: hypothetical protein MUQ65_16670, partial [Armatimonadetes bacterium]|nr:hypothetical protein [Armatimonadota bacterium]